MDTENAHQKGGGTVELPIRRADGRVVMKPHQVQRDVRRGGKTSHAAARLATYRLRKLLDDGGWMPVDDIELIVVDDSDDFIRNQRTLLATVRFVDRSECAARGMLGIRVLRSTSVLVLADN